MNLVFLAKKSGKQIDLSKIQKNSDNLHKLIEQAVPGEEYTVIDPATGKTPEGTLISREGDDLLIQYAEGDYEVVVENFWSNCTESNQCFATFDVPAGTAGAPDGIVTITQNDNVLNALLAGEVGTLADSAAAAAAVTPFPWWNVGLGLLGAGAIAALASSSGGNSGNNALGLELTDRSADGTLLLQEIRADGGIKGKVTGGQVPAGSRVRLLKADGTATVDSLDGQPITAEVNPDGTFTLPVYQLRGDGKYKIELIDGAGNHRAGPEDVVINRGNGNDVQDLPPVDTHTPGDWTDASKAKNGETANDHVADKSAAPIVNISDDGKTVDITLPADANYRPDDRLIVKDDQGNILYNDPLTQDQINTGVTLPLTNGNNIDVSAQVINQNNANASEVGHDSNRTPGDWTDDTQRGKSTDDNKADPEVTPTITIQDKNGDGATTADDLTDGKLSAHVTLPPDANYRPGDRLIVKDGNGNILLDPEHKGYYVLTPEDIIKGSVALPPIDPSNAGDTLTATVTNPYNGQTSLPGQTTYPAGLLGGDNHVPGDSNGDGTAGAGDTNDGAPKVEILDGDNDIINPGELTDGKAGIKVTLPDNVQDTDHLIITYPDGTTTDKTISDLRNDPNVTVNGKDITIPAAFVPKNGKVTAVVTNPTNGEKSGTGEATAKVDTTQVHGDSNADGNQGDGVTPVGDSANDSLGVPKLTIQDSLGENFNKLDAADLTNGGKTAKVTVSLPLDGNYKAGDVIHITDQNGNKLGTHTLTDGEVAAARPANGGNGTIVIPDIPIDVTNAPRGEDYTISATVTNANGSNPSQAATATTQMVALDVAPTVDILDGEDHLLGLSERYSSSSTNSTIRDAAAVKITLPATVNPIQDTDTVKVTDALGNEHTYTVAQLRAAGGTVYLPIDLTSGAPQVVKAQVLRNDVPITEIGGDTTVIEQENSSRIPADTGGNGTLDDDDSHGGAPVIKISVDGNQYLVDADDAAELPYDEVAGASKEARATAILDVKDGYNVGDKVRFTVPDGNGRTAIKVVTITPEHFKSDANGDRFEVPVRFTANTGTPTADNEVKATVYNGATQDNLEADLSGITETRHSAEGSASATYIKDNVLGDTDHDGVPNDGRSENVLFDGTRSPEPMDTQPESVDKTPLGVPVVTFGEADKTPDSTGPHQLDAAQAGKDNNPNADAVVKLPANTLPGDTIELKVGGTSYKYTIGGDGSLASAEGSAANPPTATRNGDTITFANAVPVQATPVTVEATVTAGDGHSVPGSVTNSASAEVEHIPGDVNQDGKLDGGTDAAGKPTVKIGMDAELANISAADINPATGKVPVTVTLPPQGHYQAGDTVTLSAPDGTQKTVTLSQQDVTNGSITVPDFFTPQPGLNTVTVTTANSLGTPGTEATGESTYSAALKLQAWDNYGSNDVASNGAADDLRRGDLIYFFIKPTDAGAGRLTGLSSNSISFNSDNDGAVARLVTFGKTADGGYVIAAQVRRGYTGGNVTLNIAAGATHTESDPNSTNSTLSWTQKLHNEYGTNVLKDPDGLIKGTEEVAREISDPASGWTAGSDVYSPRTTSSQQETADTPAREMVGLNAPTINTLGGSDYIMADYVTGRLQITMGTASESSFDNDQFNVHSAAVGASGGSSMSEMSGYIQMGNGNDSIGIHNAASTKQGEKMFFSLGAGDDFVSIDQLEVKNSSLWADAKDAVNIIDMGTSTTNNVPTGGNRTGQAQSGQDVLNIREVQDHALIFGQGTNLISIDRVGTTQNGEYGLRGNYDSFVPQAGKVGAATLGMFLGEQNDTVYFGEVIGNGDSPATGATPYANGMSVSSMLRDSQSDADRSASGIGDAVFDNASATMGALYETASPGLKTVVSLGAGDDTLRVEYGTRNAIFDGGAGNDRMEFGQLIDVTVLGGLGNDTVTIGSAKNSAINTGAGTDTLIINGHLESETINYVVSMFYNSDADWANLANHVGLTAMDRITFDGDGKNGNNVLHIGNKLLDDTLTQNFLIDAVGNEQTNVRINIGNQWNKETGSGTLNMGEAYTEGVVNAQNMSYTNGQVTINNVTYDVYTNSNSNAFHVLIEANTFAIA